MANLQELPNADQAAPASRAASRGRKAATNQAASEVNTELMPAEGAGSATNQTESAPEDHTLFVLCAENPKRKETIAARHFNHYFNPAPSEDDPMSRRTTTLRQAYERGVRGKDVSWDRDRMHILVGADADEYMKLDSDDARRDWILAKAKASKLGDISKDVLKKAGLWIEPEAPAAPTEETKNTENA